jgi:hypothetical protein
MKWWQTSQAFMIALAWIATCIGLVMAGSINPFAGPITVGFFAFWASVVVALAIVAPNLLAQLRR